MAGALFFIILGFIVMHETHKRKGLALPPRREGTMTKAIKVTMGIGFGMLLFWAVLIVGGLVILASLGAAH